MQVNFFNVVVWLRSIKYKIYLPFESNQIEENSYFQLTLKVYANKCIQRYVKMHEDNLLRTLQWERLLFF